MSARTLLLQELAHVPEGVAREMLAHLRSLVPVEKGEPFAGKDHFDSYWREFYGAFEGEEWEEPKDLPFEKREDW